MVVYCYDLVPLRTQTRWTRAQDDVMRSEYFPGLDPSMLIEPIKRVTKSYAPWYGPAHAVLCITKRLSDLGLRKRR